MDRNESPGQPMLGGNIFIQGGSFAQHNDGRTQGSKGFEQLRKEVASSAIHNSAQRADRKCHPNTRKAVLREIMDWVKSRQQRYMLIMWLNGAAGAGKSAIAHSIAELCFQEGYAIASFFFFRTDPTRNSIKPLVATLAYQLIQAIPATRNIIIEAIERNPLVFEQSFESQLNALISTPLRQVDRLSSQPSSKLPFIVIIDGVDQCNDREIQSSMLRALSDLSRDSNIPIRFMIASRRENHLLMVFNSRKMLGIVNRLTLDDKYLPEADIRLFLTEQFSEIRESHPFRHLLDTLWPTNDVVDSIVEKSSGQFIYASSVMASVSSPTHHPAERLEMVRGLRSARLDTPFAELDALYNHIFTTVTDIEPTLLVLAYSILGKKTNIPFIEEFLDLSPGSVQIALANLSSVIVCEGDLVRFLHGSLPDFLLDRTRSQRYYIDPIKWHGDFAHLWFEWQKLGQTSVFDLLPVVTVHLQNAEPTPRLHQDLLTFKPQLRHISHADYITDFLSALQKLDFNDKNRAYDHQRKLMDIKLLKSDFEKRNPPRPGSMSGGPKTTAKRKAQAVDMPPLRAKEAAPHSRPADLPSPPVAAPAHSRPRRTSSTGPAPPSASAAGVPAHGRPRRTSSTGPAPPSASTTGVPAHGRSRKTSSPGPAPPSASAVGVLAHSRPRRTSSTGPAPPSASAAGVPAHSRPRRTSSTGPAPPSASATEVPAHSRSRRTSSTGSAPPSASPASRGRQASHAVVSPTQQQQQQHQQQHQHYPGGSPHQHQHPRSSHHQRTDSGSEATANGGGGGPAQSYADVYSHPAAVAYAAAHPRRTILKFGSYLLLQTIGKGEFSKVKLGLHSQWGEEVAVKLIPRGSVDSTVKMSKLEREIEMLKTFRHPNIVRLYDVLETDKYIGIILEYGSGGELFNHVLAHRYLREKDAAKLFSQLISGVWYIHQKKVVHRNLCLENLLLDKDRNVIITNFGFANRFEHDTDDLMQTSCGSPYYAAPELVISEGLYVGSAVEIWSCGVILYAMLAGYLPFDDDPANPDGDNINLLYKYIVSTPLSFPEYISMEARDLLSKMLVLDPTRRVTLEGVMQHPWLAVYRDEGRVGGMKDGVPNAFGRTVDELERAAIEQHQMKRAAYQKQMRAHTNTNAGPGSNSGEVQNSSQSLQPNGTGTRNKYANARTNIIAPSPSRTQSRHPGYAAHGHGVHPPTVRSRSTQPEYLRASSVDQSLMSPGRALMQGQAGKAAAPAVGSSQGQGQHAQSQGFQANGSRILIRDMAYPLPSRTQSNRPRRASC